VTTDRHPIGTPTTRWVPEYLWSLPEVVRHAASLHSQPTLPPPPSGRGSCGGPWVQLCHARGSNGINDNQKACQK